MLGLSIQARQALGKLILPILFTITIGIVVLGFARRPLIDRARMTVNDALAPAYSLVTLPGEQMRVWLADLGDVTHLASENVRLRQENDNLRRWYAVAVTLANENAQLKSALNWIPDQAASFVTGHAVRDAGGVYARAILLEVGAGHQSHIGDVALDSNGMIGRVTEMGGRTVRVLLITDDASRIPVSLGTSHGSAIMAGDDSADPRLIYYPQDNPPIEGEAVVSGAQAAEHPELMQGLPQGLPVGHVHYRKPRDPVVIPSGHLDHIDIVRLFDFTATPLTEPAAPGRVLKPVIVPSSGAGQIPGLSLPFGALRPPGPKSGLVTEPNFDPIGFG